MNCQKIGLIGHPLGHTMSPFIHKRLFGLSGMEYSYSLLDIEELSPSMEKLQKLNGFNITIPHKEQMLSFLESMDRQAQLCGSVNTVACREGKLYGYTTDGVGCVSALRDAGVEPGGRILLLGNGGAARALAFAFVALSSVEKITIVSRTRSEKVKKLQSDLEVFAKEQGIHSTVMLYEEICAGEEEYDLLLNATSVGMHPNIEKSPVDGQVIRRCKLVFDAVYNPIETLLLRTAKENGIKTVNGMGMLVYQAAAAHEIWYGAKFHVTELAALCKKAEAEMENHSNR